jgi:hypothetical protein
VLHCVAVNHEFCVSLVQEPLHEVGAEATEPVLVGNNNLCDSACVDGVQKGDKVGPLKIEPAPNIAVELVFGIGLFEEGTLPFEVSALVLRTDAGVADALSLRFRFLAASVDAKDVFDVSALVEPLASAAGAERFDFATLRPLAQGGTRNSIELMDFGGRQVGRCHTRHATLVHRH